MRTIQGFFNAKGMVLKMDPEGKYVDASRLSNMTFGELVEMKNQLNAIGQDLMKAENYEVMPKVDASYKIVDALLQQCALGMIGCLGDLEVPTLD